MHRSVRVFAALTILTAGFAAAPVLAENVAKAMPPLTGRWSGTVREYRDGEITRHVPVDVSFDGKGGGVIHYPADKCRGRLTLNQALQGVYAYTERIVRGRCRSGALVAFLWKKDKLRIDREHLKNPVRVILNGPLSRMGGNVR